MYVDSFHKKSKLVRNFLSSWIDKKEAEQKTVVLIENLIRESSLAKQEETDSNKIIGLIDDEILKGINADIKDRLAKLRKDFIQLTTLLELIRKQVIPEQHIMKFKERLPM